MARASMVTTLSALIVLSHVAATWALGCPDDPEMDLCDVPASRCPDDPDVDLCDELILACVDDPEVDLCDGPAPTPSPTPAPTFPAGTALVIAQSMSFRSSGTSSEAANAVLQNLAAYMDVPEGACTANVAEVAARRLTASVPVVAFLSPLGRRLSSSTQWQADYEIQLDDHERASQVLTTAEAMSRDPLSFARSMARKFEEMGLTMDVGSITIQSPMVSVAEEEQSAAGTTPPPSTVEEGDTQASTDALIIIVVLVSVAVVGCVCAVFWLHYFRRSGHRRKDDCQGGVQGPAANPESPSNRNEEPMEDATRVSGEEQADGNDVVVM